MSIYMSDYYSQPQTGGYPPYDVSQQEKEDFLAREPGFFEQLTGALDKPGRSARQIAAEVRSWFTGEEHDFKPRELMAWVPYSDKMGLTDVEQAASGRDVLGFHDEDNFLQGVAGFAAEVVTDPLNLVTFGGASALSKGGKIFNKMGILDEVIEESAKAAGRRAETGFLPKLTKMDTTVRDGLSAYKEKVIRTSTPGEVPGILKGIDDEFLSTAQQMGLGSTKIKNILDENIGGMFGRASANPIPGFGRSMWGDTVGIMGQGETAKKIAEVTGKGMHSFKHAPGITQLRAAFDHTLAKAVSPMGQAMAQNATRAIKKSIEQSRMQASAAIELKHTLPEYFKVGHVGANGQALTQHQVSRNNILLTRFLENPTMQVPKELQPLVQAGRDLQANMRSMMEVAKSKGMHIELLEDLELTPDGFMPRQLRRFFGDGKNIADKDPSRILQTTHRTQFERTPLTKDIPEGISGIQQLSMDHNISGLLHRGGKWKVDKRPTDFDTAVQGFEETEFGGHRPWRTKEFLRHYIKTAETIPTGTTRKINFNIPGASGDVRVSLDVAGIDPVQKKWTRIKNNDGTFTKRAATEQEKDAHLDEVIDFLGQLDSRHAELGLPAYISDPIQNYISYAEVMHRAINAHDQVGEAFGREVMKMNDPRYLPEKYITLGKALENLEIVDKKRRTVRAVIDGKDAVREVEFGDPSLRMVRNIIKDRPEMADISVLNDEDLLKLIQNDYSPNTLVVPASLVKDAGRMYSVYVTPSSMEDIKPFLDHFDRISNAWRAGVTILFPKFHIRNFAGGQFNNWVIDAWSPSSLIDAQNTMLGNVVRGAGQVNWRLDGLPPVIKKQIQEQIEANNGKISDELGTRIGLAHIFSQRLWVPDMPAPTMELIENVGKGDVVDEMIRLSETPKSTPEAISGYLGNLMAKDETGRWSWTIADAIGNLNLIFPVSPGAIMGKGAYGGERGVSKLQAMGHKAAAQIEGYNRIAPFWKLLKDGWTPQAAARQVKKAQVDYSHLSEFERKVMRRTFSFYTFSRGMIPFVLEKMVQRPSGRMMRTARTIGWAQQEDEFGDWLPEYLKSKGSFRVPFTDDTDAEGKRNTTYIQSLGLPFEDTFAMTGLGSQEGMVTGFFDEVLAKSHPLGQLMYQQVSGQDPFYKKDYKTIGYGTKQIGDATVPIQNHIMNMPALDLIPGFARGAKYKPGDTWAGWRRAMTNQLLPFSPQQIKDMDRQKRSTMRDVLHSKLRGASPYYKHTRYEPKPGVEFEPGSDEWRREMVRQWYSKQ